MRIFVISLIPAIMLSASCRNEHVKTASPSSVRVKVTEIKTIPALTPLYSTGILVSDKELKLSFKTGGIIADIPVNEGSRVKKGALLASLDLSEIRAAAEQAELGYRKAMRDFGRASNLFRDSVATLEQKQDASTALDIAKSRLGIAQFNLYHSQIVAPSDGIILKKFAGERELVAAGNPVILFGSSAGLWRVRAGFSDKDIVKINIGDSAVISFDAWPGVEFYSFVEQVGEIANPLTGTYEVELSLMKTEYRLASGFIAGVDLFPSARDSLPVVPAESVVEADGNQGYIYVVTEDNEVRRIKVELVLVIGSDIALKGIPDGIREVVSGGAAYIRDGTKVEVVR